jgi:RNA recognition motif-containing protein
MSEESTQQAQKKEETAADKEQDNHVEREKAVVHVGNLSYHVSVEELREILKGFDIFRVHIPLNSRRLPRGYAFVETYRDDMFRVISHLHQRDVDGRRLFVSPARDRRSPVRRILERSGERYYDSYDYGMREDYNENRRRGY